VTEGKRDLIADLRICYEQRAELFERALRAEAEVGRLKTQLYEYEVRYGANDE
jgi:hypothetical protein